MQPLLNSSAELQKNRLENTRNKQFFFLRTAKNFSEKLYKCFPPPLLQQVHVHPAPASRHRAQGQQQRLVHHRHLARLPARLGAKRHSDGAISGGGGKKAFNWKFGKN